MSARIRPTGRRRTRTRCAGCRSPRDPPGALRASRTRVLFLQRDAATVSRGPGTFTGGLRAISDSPGRRALDLYDAPRGRAGGPGSCPSAAWRRAGRHSPRARGKPDSWTSREGSGNGRSARCRFLAGMGTLFPGKPSRAAARRAPRLNQSRLATGGRRPLGGMALLRARLAPSSTILKCSPSSGAGSASVPPTRRGDGRARALSRLLPRHSGAPGVYSKPPTASSRSSSRAGARSRPAPQGAAIHRSDLAPARASRVLHEWKPGRGALAASAQGTSRGAGREDNGRRRSAKARAVASRWSRAGDSVEKRPAIARRRDLNGSAAARRGREVGSEKLLARIVSDRRRRPESRRRSEAADVVAGWFVPAGRRSRSGELPGLGDRGTEPRMAYRSSTRCRLIIAARALSASRRPRSLMRRGKGVVPLRFSPDAEAIDFREAGHARVDKRGPDRGAPCCSCLQSGAIRGNTETERFRAQPASRRAGAHLAAGSPGAASAG